MIPFGFTQQFEKILSKKSKGVAKALELITANFDANFAVLSFFDFSG
jgi:hypothetical protein